MKGWTNLMGLKELTRVDILDANDWLDALEEAEDAAQARADANAKR